MVGGGSVGGDVKDGDGEEKMSRKLYLKLRSQHVKPNFKQFCRIATQMTLNPASRVQRVLNVAY